MTKQEAKTLALASAHESRMNQLKEESDYIAYALGEYLLAQIAVNLAEAWDEGEDDEEGVLAGFNPDGSLNETGFDLAVKAICFHAEYDECVRHKLAPFRAELIDYFMDTTPPPTKKQGASGRASEQ